MLAASDRRYRVSLPLRARERGAERFKGWGLEEGGVTLGIFAGLVLLLAVGLRLNPREVPSPLIGKPAPTFELPLLIEPDKRFSEKHMLGKVWIPECVGVVVPAVPRRASGGDAGLARRSRARRRP